MGAPALPNVQRPNNAWLDGQMRSRETLGRAPGEPTKFAGLVTEYPFGSFMTLERAFTAVAAIADAFDQEDVNMARGRTMQALRWLLFSLQSPKDQSLAWKMTFLPDPTHLVCPARATTAIDLNDTILSPN